MSRSDEVTVSGVLVRQTDAAILVNVEDVEVWLPKSQIDYTEDAFPGEEIDIVLPEWLANEKELDY